MSYEELPAIVGIQAAIKAGSYLEVGLQSLQQPALVLWPHSPSLLLVQPSVHLTDQVAHLAHQLQLHAE